MQTHIDALTELLGADQLLTGSDISERYQVDWSKEAPHMPEFVVRPRNTADVSTFLRYCSEHKLPVVPQGGLTGLAGGATPRDGEIALSLERLNGITELDKQSMTMTVKAGTPLQVIQQAAEAEGLRLPVDLGARGSCQIGGNVSTNAGGNQVLSFGMTRALVLGLEAVQADGTIVPAYNKMLKNNAGYDLKQLFIGSEGTLGIVTEVVLRLFPLARNKHTAVVALDSFESVVKLLNTTQSKFARLSAFEAMWNSFFQCSVGANPNLSDPFDEQYPFYVLLESENDALDQFQQVLFDELEAGNVLDAVIAQSGKDSDQFWAIRDSIPEVMSTIPQPYANFDVGLPVSQMEDFLDKVQSSLSERFENVESLTFGHLGDGNIHILAWTTHEDNSQAIYKHVYQLLNEFGGTVTAEHGIGYMKADYLKLCRSPEEIALMRVLKQAMDPNNILNPGRVLS
ncbi:FAD-binding oxidoreductase [Leucothrix pacifica]|uniref:FAD-binding oxidoreductase n=1 Tax=Leucothrix pacifica TaxID=1247513 RepID=A0A317CFK5_9GAMM|nr:FAD-binding oxidoreductase [Leucothrix pacifica]PWQ97394.1 FAD-binding oxidoreductase [Leucothrix pacifica]